MVKSIKMSVEQYETVGLHDATVSAQVNEPRLVFVSHYHLLPTNQIFHNSPRLSRLVRTQAVFIRGPMRDYVLLFTLWQKETRLMFWCRPAQQTVTEMQHVLVLPCWHNREANWACCHGYREEEGWGGKQSVEKKEFGRAS